jgi:nitrate/TMAO reductase-like tetraheme cytochrome c subunit
LRITETRWFQQVHSEVSERTWKRPKIKSAANCIACHIQAEKGIYDGHSIIIPK